MNKNSFIKMKTQHAKDVLYFLLLNKEEFSVVAYLKAISFNPTLPKEIMENFDEAILFILANYTLQSAHIKDDNLIFEAGFGKENFGSEVTIPLSNIIQIIQNNTPLFVNPFANIINKNPKNPFLQNPKNRKFLN